MSRQANLEHNAPKLKLQSLLPHFNQFQYQIQHASTILHRQLQIMPLAAPQPMFVTRSLEILTSLQQYQPISYAPVPVPNQLYVAQNSLLYRYPLNSCLLQPQNIQAPVPLLPIQAQEQQNQIANNTAENYLFTIQDLTNQFLELLANENTENSYRKAFEKFFSQGFLKHSQTLLELSKQNLEELLDNMMLKIRRNLTSKKTTPLGPSIKQQYASALISWSGFLQRRSKSVFKKIQSSKEGTSRTFTYKTVKTNSSISSEKQLHDFFTTLKTISPIGYLFANLQYHGIRRVSEVTCLKVCDIHFEEQMIIYYPKKTQKTASRVQVYYPLKIFTLIQDFLSSENRSIKEASNKYEFLFRDLKDWKSSLNPSTIQYL